MSRGQNRVTNAKSGHDNSRIDIRIHQLGTIIIALIQIIVVNIGVTQLLVMYAKRNVMLYVQKQDRVIHAKVGLLNTRGVIITIMWDHIIIAVIQTVMCLIGA